MYGSANIKYKGSHPIVFAMTGLGAGLGAVDGLKNRNISEAFIKMIIGGTIGFMFGCIIEGILKSSGEKSVRNAKQILMNPYRKICVHDAIKY